MLGILAFGGCLDPTQMTVEITTDVACADVRQTQIFTSSGMTFDAARTETVNCKDGRIGSLVIVPTRDANDKFGVQIVTRLANGKSITARRYVGYVPHARLRMPIKMSASCIDVSCRPDQTCLQGRCVDAAIDPQRCAGVGCNEDALSDGGAGDASVTDATSDVSPIDGALDASSDGGKPCMKALATMRGKLFTAWPFDEPSGPFFDIVGMQAPVNLPMNQSAVRVGMAGSCPGMALSFNGAQSLSVTADNRFATPPFALSFFMKLVTPTVQDANVIGRSNGTSGWRITTNNFMGGAIALSICNGNFCTSSGTTPLSPGFHFVVAWVDANGNGGLTVDGVTGNVSLNGYAPFLGGDLVFGPSQSILDEVYFYDQ